MLDFAAMVTRAWIRHQAVDLGDGAVGSGLVRRNQGDDDLIRWVVDFHPVTLHYVTTTSKRYRNLRPSLLARSSTTSTPTSPTSMTTTSSSS
ncbi:hypothetical protein PR202_gb13506 [Eleusine coracana subsp. coracana]|uniref:Uncharacterized protein n=1 Tax=Eleusine coracana subsp. coracana TaxID=191504 RepID=A0AAV5EU96_ELECO|nr:hypothetical protein PR202_gb13506 [Eleusine coracana subsp. coracana]